MLLMEMLPMILFYLCLFKLSLSMLLTMKMKHLLLNEM